MPGMVQRSAGREKAFRDHHANSSGGHAPWRWMDGTGFFAGEGVFIHATGRNDRKGGYVWIGPKTERPLQFLRPYVGDDWDYVAI